MEIKDKIKAIKLEALQASYLHKKHIKKYSNINSLIDFVSIAVPVFYLSPRLLAKGTIWSFYIDSFGEILSAILMAMVIFKLVYKFQENEVRHAIVLRRNLDVLHESEQFLSKEFSEDTFDQFLIRVKDIDEEDIDLLKNVSEVQDQEAYREALKQI